MPPEAPRGNRGLREDDRHDRRLEIVGVLRDLAYEKSRWDFMSSQLTPKHTYTTLQRKFVEVELEGSGA